MIGNRRILLQARTSTSAISVVTGTKTSNNISIIFYDKISIGEKCQIGDQVMSIDSDFHDINPEIRTVLNGKTSSVVIGDNVWLGSRVMVLKGVIIGDRCVIASDFLVNHSIP